MAIFNMTTPQVVPSDVFGYEVNTDVGYGRETFTIDVGATPVRVGSVFVVDYATMTAVPANGNEPCPPAKRSRISPPEPVAAPLKGSTVVGKL